MIKSLLAAGFLVCSVASADPICISGSLSTYIGLAPGGCMLGTNTVSGFTLFPAITGATAISPAAVTVTPTNSSTNPALAFSATAGAASNQLLELLFGYNITGALTSDMITLSGSNVSGDGATTYIQNYCLGGKFTPNPPNVPGPCSSSKANSLLVLNSGSDSATFLSVPSIGILDDLTFDGGSGGSAAGAIATDRFTSLAPVSAVPEPSSILLVASVLAAGLVVRSTKRGNI